MLRGFDLDIASRDYVVQGFPRSGNTFLAMLLKEFAARPVNIFTHLHVPAMFTLALENDKTIFMPVREPLGSVVSLIQMKGWSCGRALDHYVEYYTNAQRFIDRVQVMDFKNFTRDIPLALQIIEQHSGIPYKKPASHEKAEERVFALIDELNIRRTGVIRVNDLHRPHAGRQAGKSAIVAILRARHAEKLLQCEALYEQFAVCCLMRRHITARTQNEHSVDVVPVIEVSANPA
ncbi:MAG: hypothetical protein AB7L92_08955 [Alphaproteobacteria bacterium]